MTQQNYDPSAEYNAPAEEWTALLTLAKQPSPAQAIATGDWHSVYFASDGATDAFAQLAQAEAPLLLDVPHALDGVATLDDIAQIRETRVRLATLAQARKLADLQANLARHLRTVRATGKADGISDLVSAARGALDTIAAMGNNTRQRAAVATMGTLAHAYWAQVAEARDAMPTSIAGLDDALGGGLQAKRLLVLLGAPGSGKTTLANQISEHIASAGRPVVYLTTEDTPAALLAKTIARVGQLDYGAVLQGREVLRGQITSTIADIGARKSAQRLLYVEDLGGLMLPELRDIAREHFSRHSSAGAGVLVVDYLQRWARSHRGPDARDELRIVVGRLTEELRSVARELNCCVVALASQNRASGYGKNGDMSALATAKESGDVEFTADCLMALVDDDKRLAPPNQKARVLRIDKNRLGPGEIKIEMNWYPSRQTWTAAAK